MKDVKWIGCVAHTLHLVIGKGLMPAQILILRIKRLINFFMRPKQSERLEEIQKQFPNIEGEEDNEEKETENNNNQNDNENDNEICELLCDNLKLVSLNL
jgi:hypothetical protein